MNDKTGGNRKLRRAGVLAVVAPIAMLATACGVHVSSSAGATSAGLATLGQKIAFARCVRSHGVPDYPDPNASGLTPIRESANGADGTINSGRLSAADSACQYLLPRVSAAQAQQKFTEMLSYAQCIRGHGVPNFPDPTRIGGGVVLNINGVVIHVYSPQFQAAERACQHLLPAGKRPLS
jgi:hypothetical protein